MTAGADNAADPKTGSGRANGDATGIAVVVLNFNGADDTVACLESIARLDPGPDRVHVVDNASEDDSVVRVRRQFPAVKVSENPTNLGFGAGLNPILEALVDADLEWIWLLNNDTCVEPDTLDAMLTHARSHPDAGAIGARIVDMEAPGTVQTWGGGRIGRWRGNSRHFTTPVPDERLDYLTGASILLRTEALRGIGLFDPRYFLYWEDVDLCLRLRAAGWALTVAQDACVRHRLSGATGEATPRKDELINASAVRFFRQHGPLGGWPAIVTGAAGRIARRMLRGDLAAARAVWRGTVSGLRQL